MQVYDCVKLPAFCSPCARIIVEDSAYSSRAEQDMRVLLQIVGWEGAKSEQIPVILGCFKNNLFEIFYFGKIGTFNFASCYYFCVNFL